MIVWQGFGFLALLLPIALVLLMDFVFGAVAGKDYLAAHPWINFAVIAFINSPTLWFLGRWLNRKPGKILIDPENGEKVELRERHTLFWIPLEYWGLIWLVLSMVFIFRGFEVF